MALETLVEREAVVSGTTPSRRWAAEAGLHFIRLLTLHEASTHRALFLRSDYALGAPSSEQRRSLDSESRRFLDIVAGRVVDGSKLHVRLASLRARHALAEFFTEAV